MFKALKPASPSPAFPTKTRAGVCDRHRISWSAWSDVPTLELGGLVCLSLRPSVGPAFIACRLRYKVPSRLQPCPALKPLLSLPHLTPPTAPLSPAGPWSSLIFTLSRAGLDNGLVSLHFLPDHQLQEAGAGSALLLEFPAPSTASS